MRALWLSAVILFGCQTARQPEGTAKPPRAERKHAPDLAFVLLAKPGLPTAEAVLASYKRIAPGEPLPTVKVDEKGLGVMFGEATFVMLGSMGRPVPEGEADAAFENSLSRYSSNVERLPAHSDHLVAVFGDEAERPRRDQLIRFTQVLAAVADASKAVGVYWGNAGATHTTDFFVASASEQNHDLMIVLWTGVEVVESGPDRVSMLSLGMQEQLGLLDLRVTTPRAKLPDTIGQFYDMLAYVAQRGEDIPDGDTVGSSADERLTVKYEPHPVEKERTVWRVDVP